MLKKTVVAFFFLYIFLLKTKKKHSAYWSNYAGGATVRPHWVHFMYLGHVWAHLICCKWLSSSPHKIMMNAPCMAHAAKPAQTPTGRTGAAAQKDTSCSLTEHPAEPDKVSCTIQSGHLPSNQHHVNVSCSNHKSTSYFFYFIFFSQCINLIVWGWVVAIVWQTVILGTR